MELRHNPLKDIWVAMAPERKGKGGDLEQINSGTKAFPSGCPFCPGNEKFCTPDIMTVTGGDGWLLRVFPNKYPALRVEGELKKYAAGFYDAMTPVGAHEVIVYTSEHALAMQNYDRDTFHRLFMAVSDRMTDLEKDFRFAYINFFINRGLSAGGSMSHPHAQLLAYPFIPAIINTELKASIAHYHMKGRCLICDLIEFERAAKVRVIAENNHFTALVQYAAAVPFEISVYPKEHDHDFMRLSASQASDLSDIMELCFKKAGELLNDPDFNLILCTSPTEAKINSTHEYSTVKECYHWHLEIIPRLGNTSGGSECSGVYINTVLPEEAAELLR